MIGTNLADSSDTSKFLPDGVNPRPGGYVMRPTNRLFLFLLISFFLFGTVPVVHALAAGSDVDTADEIYHDDPGLNYICEITSPAQEDYLQHLRLWSGQKLIIDVDAEKTGSTLDSYFGGIPIAMADTVDVSDKSNGCRRRIARNERE